MSYFFRAMAGGRSVGENYAFVGMHHVFDDVMGHPGKHTGCFTIIETKRLGTNSGF